jgi:fructose-1,6-bisphosphatase/inositol monophosphatase family enzyme
MVAAGTLDLVIEAGLKSWDIEAAVPLLAGAGGLITDWHGVPVGRHGGRVVVASNETLLGEVLPHLALEGA